MVMHLNIQVFSAVDKSGRGFCQNMFRCNRQSPGEFSAPGFVLGVLFCAESNAARAFRPEKKNRSFLEALSGLDRRQAASSLALP